MLPRGSTTVQAIRLTTSSWLVRFVWTLASGLGQSKRFAPKIINKQATYLCTRWMCHNPGWPTTTRATQRVLAADMPRAINVLNLQPVR